MAECPPPLPPQPPPLPPSAPSTSHSAGYTVRSVGDLLTAAELRPGWSQVDSTELVALWEQLPLCAQAPRDLALNSIQSLCASVTSLGDEWKPLPESVCVGVRDEDELRKLVARLAALEAVLAMSMPGIPSESAPFIFAQLNQATDALMVYAASQMLRATRASEVGDATMLRAAAICLPALLLVRCTSVAAFTARELLSLAGGDLTAAVAVAIFTGRAVSTLGESAFRTRAGLLQLQVRLWQAFYHLSTPGWVAQLVGQSGEKTSNDTPIEDLLAEQIAHAHRFAKALVQFDAIAAVCDWGAESAQHKTILLSTLLRTLHNLTASPHLEAAGRIVARQLIVNWPKFGFKLLAPYLRRLLTNSEVSAPTCEQSGRELRRDLRTLGWLLHHSPELREYARPLCGEIAMKAASATHSAETLAVAVGVAANAGALTERGALYAALDVVDAAHKIQASATFPAETNRLWIIREAWELVEDLQYWPKELATAITEAADDADAQAIAKLQPWAGAGSSSTGGFNFLDPGGSWPHSPYDDWDDGLNDLDDKYEEWDEPDCEEDCEEDSEEDREHSLGPLGLLDVFPPAAPVPVSPSPLSPAIPPTRLLCDAPEAFRCAIDGRLCVDPVRSPNGVLYERSSITTWLTWNKVCPVHGVPLSASDLFDDVSVSEATSNWLTYAEGGEPSFRVDWTP